MNYFSFLQRTFFLFMNNAVARAFFAASPDERAEVLVSDPQSDGLACKAGNKKCNSLFAEAECPSLVPLPCDLCCNEPRFCRDCCCILCSKTIDLKHGGYSYIKCEAMVNGYICGHVAHLNCALRSYMAGTVGGSIGLDAEYYCRRCDTKTFLVPHVTTVLKTCESIDSRDEIEKILNIVVCILRGSQKSNAKGLLNRIESAIKEVRLKLAIELNRFLAFFKKLSFSFLRFLKNASKCFWYLHQLKCGTSLEDIWKVKETDTVMSTEFNFEHNEPENSRIEAWIDLSEFGNIKISELEELKNISFFVPSISLASIYGSLCKFSLGYNIFHNGNGELGPTNHQDLVDDKSCLEAVLSVSSDYRSEYLKIECEIDQVLQSLRKAQESEYKIAEEQLCSQKVYLRHLYQQLEKERSELPDRSSGNEADASLNAVLSRVNQIKYEVMRLKEMEEVANGFGRTPKGVLKEYFGLEIED
ncbi:hypothetical protein GOBAR_AA27244 [Gossypium barbadense]|uniref:Uncharacterized protein n=1 Tax=Gossypium barbadense TaxID=3634 RepID=A0A2P5WQS5_GOSBA|nr:hypothetical protein GOBAR_AA27244 [Gossypium barbadense]